MQFVLRQLSKKAGDENNDHDVENDTLELDLENVDINQPAVSTKRPTNSSIPKMLTKKTKERGRRIECAKENSSLYGESNVRSHSCTRTRGFIVYIW